MQCVDCFSSCRGRCSECRQPLCAVCRDDSKWKLCQGCQDAKKATRLATLQQNRLHRQLQKQAVLTDVLPLHLYPTQPVPAIRNVAHLRPVLSAMSDEQFADWSASTHEGIEAMRMRMREYLDRRKAFGRHTPVDSAMERDVRLCDDLLRALDELPELRANRYQREETDMLPMALYDSAIQKVKGE